MNSFCNWFVFLFLYKLFNLLLSTCSSIIIEGNLWQDTFWGVVNGEGQNNLGLLLMLLRNELRMLKENEC